MTTTIPRSLALLGLLLPALAAAQGTAPAAALQGETLLATSQLAIAATLEFRRLQQVQPAATGPDRPADTATARPIHLEALTRRQRQLETVRIASAYRTARLALLQEAATEPAHRDDVGGDARQIAEDAGDAERRRPASRPGREPQVTQLARD